MVGFSKYLLLIVINFWSSYIFPHSIICVFMVSAVNCMYWEKRFPPLLSMDQLQQLMKTGCPLVGICDITCDIGGSIEFVNKSTSIERPFFR